MGKQSANNNTSSPKAVAAAGNKKKGAADEEALPWYAQLVNHIMTPGSSLTTGVWNFFNALIIGLYLIWLTFLVSFPDSIHTWVFFALLTGLAISTNWFMREIFAAKEDFASQQEQKKKEGDAQPASAAKKADNPTESPAASPTANADSTQKKGNKKSN